MNPVMQSFHFCLNSCLGRPTPPAPPKGCAHFYLEDAHGFSDEASLSWYLLADQVSMLYSSLELLQQLWVVWLETRLCHTVTLYDSSSIPPGSSECDTFDYILRPLSMIRIPVGSWPLMVLKLEKVHYDSHILRSHPAMASHFFGDFRNTCPLGRNCA